MKILKEEFGLTKDKEKVTKFILENSIKSQIHVLNYGGIITNILVPDKCGNIENITLGFDTLEGYTKSTTFFGALIGRIAGRISDARFSIDGINFKLYKNNNGNNLHGGPIGFDKVIWKVRELRGQDFVGLELSYLSPDGDQGFPGNLNVKATYIFNNSNELTISYFAECDRKTIVNLTNHSYFNLSGNYKEDVLYHDLTLSCDYFCPVNEDIIPTGEIKSVEGTAFDFREHKKVGKDFKNPEEQLKIAGGGYDHAFILNKDNKIAVTLKHEVSGRMLTIETTQPAAVIYSGNSLDDTMILHDGIRCMKHSGICFETQDYPNSINEKNFKKSILEPGQKYIQSTKYKFSII